MARTGRIVKLALTLSLLALASAIALPVLTGRPVVSYASSGSMEPTIGTLDGFLVNPWPTTIAVGDIIVFESVTQNGPAVHRVVGRDGQGWLTQGDANAKRDQDVGEPSITGEKILGKVLTTRQGEPIVIERLGAAYLEARVQVVQLELALGGPRQLMALVLVVLAGVFAVPALLAKPKRSLPTRMPMRLRSALRRWLPRGILGRHVGATLLLLVLVSTAFAATHAREDVVATIVVLEDKTAGDSVRAAGPGAELVREIEFSSLGITPTVVLLEPETDALRPARESLTLGPRSSATVPVSQRAGDVVGLQEDVLHVWRYPAVLPASAIAALHDVAPGLPYAAFGAIVIATGALWFAALRIGTLPVARSLGIPEDWL